ncbi:M50 family metallopeptidase [Ilumatobacter nonamiensis]|uniref:M50 family metallopeptidase n=1 Tax=Ilumatobacter nonamiensis TaxID=467093 RepID=UPI00034AEA3B|nr:M50 family metallopeptidase [Ilumatobacter nonamiensis]
MTNQLEHLPPPDPQTRADRFRSEIVAGGSAEEASDDELAGGWKGALAMAGIAALFVWLYTLSVWWFIFVVGLVISIFLHEAGHFLTAKWTGMKVTQFFMFMGPRLWSFRRGETEYGVRLLPVGAFVRIIGMHRIDTDVAPEDEGRTYRQKSYPRRLLVISAGSIMHMLIAVALLFVVYVGQGERTDEVVPEVYVAQAIDGLPAEQAGIQDDDRILSIGGIALTDSADLGAVVRSFEPGQTVDFVVERDGVEQVVPVGLGSRTDVPEDDELFGTAYIGVAPYSPLIYEEHGVFAAAGNAVTDIVPVAWESVQGVFKALNPVNVISHLDGSNEDLTTRPVTLVGVTAVSDDVGDTEGIYGVLWLLAVLNVFVGVFNMFPLLPLDGGHAAVATYERVREAMRGGRERYFADVERLMPLAMGVVAFLFFFMFAGLYLDITKPL